MHETEGKTTMAIYEKEYYVGDINYHRNLYASISIVYRTGYTMRPQYKQIARFYEDKNTKPVFIHESDWNLEPYTTKEQLNSFMNEACGEYRKYLEDNMTLYESISKQRQ